MSSIPSSQRDPYIDHIRGLFHVVMLVDHLCLLFPGVFPILANVFEAAGFVSVAEGFVFLSGLVTGMIYTRVLRTHGLEAMFKKALRRALVIYASYIGSVVVLLILLKFVDGTQFDWASWGSLAKMPFLEALFKAAVCVYQPNFLEILPMYSVFIAYAPLVLIGLERGKTRWIVFTSLLLWGAEQFGVRTTVLESMFGGEDVNFGYFSSPAWQILFVAGLIFGRRAIGRTARPRPNRERFSLIAIVLAIALLALRHGIIPVAIPEVWTARSSLGWLRLLDFACLAFLALQFRTTTEKFIAFRSLAFLSRHSLPVFAFHLLPIYIAAVWVGRASALPAYTQAAFIIFCAVGLFVIASSAECIRGISFFRGAVGRPDLERI